MKYKALASNIEDQYKIRYLCINSFGNAEILEYSSIKDLSKYGMMDMGGDVRRVDNNAMHSLISQLNKEKIANENRAKLFINKCKMLGITVELNIYGENDIELESVSVNGNIKSFEIPDFITSFKKKDRVSTLYGGSKTISPFYNCRFEHIIISSKISILDGLLSGIKSDKITIEFRHPETVVSISGLLEGAKNIEHIHFINGKTINLVTVKQAFSGCTSLINNPLSDLYTKNIIDATQTFKGCENIKRVSFSDTDISSVKYLEETFELCKGLEEIEFGKNNGAKPITVSFMLSNCISLYKIDIENIDTSELQNICGLFSDCKAIQKIDLSNNDLDKVIDATEVFMGCTEVEQIDLGENTLSECCNFRYMFSKCSKLKQIGIEKLSVKNAKALNNMFYGCESIEVLIIPHLEITDKCSTISGMFKGCTSLRYLDISGIKTYFRNNGIDHFVDLMNIFSGTSIIKLVSSDEDIQISWVRVLKELSKSNE